MGATENGGAWSSRFGKAMTGFQLSPRASVAMRWTTPRARGSFLGAMRSCAVAWLLLGGLLLALWIWPRGARAGESRRNVDAANAALLAEPPRREEARSALRAAAAASDDAEAVAEADFLLGQLDEADGAFPQALLDDRASIDAAATSRWAFRASDRIAWLRARSEGDFAPLRRLESVRHDPALSDDPATLQALAREADGFPPGMVRVEARLLVAEAWLGRLDRPDDAIALLRLVTAETKIDALTLRLAERELVDVLVARGRIDEAIAEVAAHPGRLDPKFVQQVKRLRTRRFVALACEGILAAFVMLATFALVRASRRGALAAAWTALRGLLPTAALFVGFSALGGGFLASQYERGNAGPFLMLGAGVLPLVLIARLWSAVGSQAPAARLARSLLCGATVMAAAFVLLETVTPQYLEGFGL